ncbi:hypothetical protein NUITMVRE5_15220 [Enterococcus faecium]|nr:hypothetical protein NUITMVRE10_14370 [Enterococcus faecium]GMR75702.1 hypothetical protein NUITMVRE11_14290 [Enterococcus faecium]GMS36121.1 hypothetical protein NUITMVRE30_09880 [Enterococcus faecium]GMS58542.1 hypothetical protein NUITMVRE3_15170 [Enterococcus faecium]GMS61520.1 hypothetical protein NUITMVRE4_15140 [Enterococcus faecium]
MSLLSDCVRCVVNNREETGKKYYVAVYANKYDNKKDQRFYPPVNSYRHSAFKAFISCLISASISALIR